MNIGLIGSGGREHAICERLVFSKNKPQVYCFPGNAGTSLIAKNINVNFNDFKKLYKKIKELKISVVIIGPEEPLVRGLVDFLSSKGLEVFGPSKFAAKLEGSKAFMKSICNKYQIPTAKFQVCKNIKQVKNFLSKTNLPIVVKADGLAAGKGVMICNEKTKVLKFSKEIFGGRFNNSKKLVMEEFLIGEELSYFAIVDKYNFKFLGSAQDHKKVGEGEVGLNTGGMGAYSPAPILTKNLEKKIKKKIIIPTLRALKDMGHHYKGFLYAGLMISKGEPFLIEYNVRMGDPECQVILPRIKSDFLKILIASIRNKIKNTNILWHKKKCMNIVICAKGYPKKYKKDILIPNKLKLKEKDSIKILHAGTKFINGKIYSSGGRILNVCSTGENFRKMRSKIIKLIKLLNLKNTFFRKDIGWRIIKK